MPSALDVAKRELVKVLKLLAAKHKVCVDITREGFRKVCREVVSKTGVEARS